MVSKENARGTGQRNPRVEVLPPLPDMHGMLGTMEHMLSQRDQRIALLEVHQQETDHRVKNSLQLVASLVRAQSGLPAWSMGRAWLPRSPNASDS